MQRVESALKKAVVEAVKDLYNIECPAGAVQIQKTRPEFQGDITLVVFPMLKMSRKSPEQTAADLGSYLTAEMPEVKEFNVIKGFLNLTVFDSYYIGYLNSLYADVWNGMQKGDRETVIIEYSSPNTNKPLHLGHVRNNLLGYAVCNILEACGKQVVKTNLVNDRGIHICKSMLAWKLFGNGETPSSTGKKGDHLVGDYYVIFEKENKKQINALVDEGLSTEEAEKNTPLIREAQEMLRKWEAGDPETISLWREMNSWVYSGFDTTYERLGVKFDKIYYESETWQTGKKTVLEGLENSIFYMHDDGSVWVDLKNEGLDEKVLLRSDGTSVYITQDIGTARLRHQEYNPSKMIYVVGNEQNYHFKVLALILDKLGFPWAKSLHHLSYGMVELPEGKMKSREGLVVDADDLMDEMISTARDMSDELGKLEGLEDSEKADIVKLIGMGALKYFILKVDPVKNMTFNPRESIDFDGNTGPFIQYTYARIRSVLRKAGESGIVFNEYVKNDIELNKKEKNLLKFIHDYHTVVRDAAEGFNPSLIANFAYDIVREYNQFYHDYSILKEENRGKRDFRLVLSSVVSEIVKGGMGLLGIEMPERM